MGQKNKVLDALRAVPSEIIEFEELKFEVRGLTMKATNRLYQQFSDDNIEIDRWNVALVIETVFDPDSGDPMFDPADRDLLLSGRADLVNRLADVAMRLSGMKRDDAERAKGLAETPFGEPSSS